MLAFDVESHTYTLDGKPVPSVTTIIRALEREALARVPAEILEWKRGLGQQVHMACQLDDEGDLHEGTLDERIVPYMRAWRAFRDDFGFRVRMNEQPLASRRYRFAGTVDRVGTITRPMAVDRNRMYQGPAIIDLKTRLDLGDAIGVQLAGYQKLLAENNYQDDDAYGHAQTQLRVAVRLGADGKYEYRVYEDPEDHSCFQACLVQHHWMAKRQ